jgi:arylsulfatase A-like enzyme
VADLKFSGLFDSSVIILTADHGDSLGEGGRFGHAYTLYPEIVRIPLIAHVPEALRSAFTWDLARPAFTTDLTPTLYRLLGHDITPPGDFYGEPLMRPAGAAAPPPRDRMLASSYGAVYGALMRNGTQLFVANAIERREQAFDIGAGPSPGTEVPLDAPTRQMGTELIQNTVQSIGRAYGLTQPQ